MADPELVGVISIFWSAFIIFLVSRDLEEEKFFGFAAKALGAGVSLWLILGGMAFGLVTLQNAGTNTNAISITNTLLIVTIAPVLLVTVYLGVVFLNKVFSYFKELAKKKRSRPDENGDEF